MALRNQSLFLYGYQVTELNRSIDFKAAFGGPELMASLRLGDYSLTSLLAEIKRAMEAADDDNTYDVTADRTIAGGTQNRVTIATDGAFLSLLFASGSRAASTCAQLIGFAPTDRTGAATYTGTLTSGIVVLSERPGYEYVDPRRLKDNRGSVNLTASGLKEAIVFQTVAFGKVRFKFIAEADTPAWEALLLWMIGQRLWEFTPDVTVPTRFFNATLESTAEDGKGLGFLLAEMTPSYVGLYDTGSLKFRVKE